MKLTIYQHNVWMIYQNLEILEAQNQNFMYSFKMKGRVN